MATIKIPGIVFDDLSSGYGDEAAMGLLKSAMRTRRLMLLKEISGKFAQTRPFLGLLAEAQERDAAQFDTVLVHPPVEPWAWRFLSGVKGVDYMGLLAVSAAARAGLRFELPGLPVREGALVLPTLGTVTDLDAAEANVVGDGELLIIECGSLRLELPRPFTASEPRWRPTPAIDVGQVSIAIEDTDPQRDCFGFQVARRLTAQELSDFGDRLSEAWRYLEAWFPRHMASMRAALRMIVPLAHPAPGRSVSATAQGMLGAVAVSLSMPVHNLALQLLHEYMHMKLWALQDMVSLHQAGGAAIHFAPWRSDPRTVPALLQGAYAHVGVTDFWRIRRLEADGAERREASLEYAFWLEQTRDAVAELLNSGELTGEGERLARGMDRTLADWAGREAIPVELSELARDLVTVAAVRWRLRNTRPATRYIDYLVARRAEGGLCPDPLESPDVRPAAKAQGWQPSELEKLIRARHAGKQVTSEDPAHRAFLAGDYEQAKSLYCQAVQGDPDRDDAWSGLALALARLGDTAASRSLTSRPDLVRGISARRGDPVAAARWLCPP